MTTQPLMSAIPSTPVLESFTLPAGTLVKVNGLTAYLDRETIIRTSRENFELMLEGTPERESH